MSETPKHTPGPWKIERGEFNPAFGGIVAEVKVPDGRAFGRRNYRRVAIKAYDVQHRDEDPAFVQGEANACLIAAAPDLLEALKRFTAWDEDPHATEADGAEARRLIAAAIAKATGHPTESPK